VVIGYIFSRFGILYQEKSGNPAADTFYVFPQSTTKSTRYLWLSENTREQSTAGLSL
jgi:hypothetical protein